MALNRLQRGLRVTFLGMGINALLAMSKLLAGLWGNSHALIADAIESMADMLSAVIVWRSLVLAAKPADADHPYGHGKAEPIASAIVATTLLLAATGIGFKSVQGMLNPARGAPEPFTLAVLIGVVLIKETLFRFVLREGTTVGSSAVRSDAWHHRSDAITSLAAAIGISVALIGGKGYESADDVAAVVAAGIIAWNGWRLMRPALDELMDAAPNLALIAEIRESAASVAGVHAVEKCIVRKMGYHYLVDMHIEVEPQMTVRQAHDIAHQVKNRVRSRLPVVHDVLVHIEPAK
ncbi:MAG: cation diffusion facilitator family transporter [Verrucomicrobia bacterium]|nr:cation diffusion facilitator family transporter [Verrucomicrobiota bacterium]